MHSYNYKIFNIMRYLYYCINWYRVNRVLLYSRKLYFVFQLLLLQLQVHQVLLHTVLNIPKKQTRLAFIRIQWPFGVRV